MSLVTILIPHYKTRELTTLCLRSLRKHTDAEKVRVIVLDNGSRDTSSDYLRSLDWIEHVEREVQPGDPAGVTHCKALDSGVAMTETPYFLSFHTDTIVIRPGWLEYLIAAMERQPDTAGVGSWKLEHESLPRRLGKKAEELWQTQLWHPLTRAIFSAKAKGRQSPFLRSHCALYDTALFKHHAKVFNDGQGTAGKGPHKKLVDAGYQMTFLPSSDLSQYIRHINHATMVLHPETSATGTVSSKQIKRVHRELLDVDYQSILADDTLDK